jgi:DNA end-binding protein Ku
VTGEIAEETVKGYEFERGRYVVIDDEELAQLTPDKSSSIELTTFVDEGDIDPIYVDTPYYLGPNTGGDRSYTVLEKALKNQGKVAIGKVVVRSKEYLCIVRPAPNGGLMLSTLRWHDQIRTNDEVLPENVQVSDKEVEMAEKLIDMMSESKIDIKDLKDTYTEELKKLIEDKAQGKVVSTSRAKESEEDLPDDIFAALEASIKEKSQQRAV